jgi:integrase
VDAARALAQVRLGAVAAGEDPLAERVAVREVPVFSAWVDEYLEAVRRRKKQPRHDERYLGQAKAIWGNRPLRDLSRRDIQAELVKQAAKGNTTANRWLASVRACLEAAKDQELIEVNPAMGTKQLREPPPRSRVLSDEEFSRTLDAIAALPDPYQRAAFLVLLETGARKSEVLRARWDDIDFDGSLWRIPSPKSDTPQIIPLAKSTVAVLRALPRMEPWILPGRKAGRHLTDLKGPWARVREVAGLEGVTIHDVRRTFGLHVARGAGLHLASKLLRHSDIRVTEKVYAPLGIDSLREAVEDTHRRRKEKVEKGKGK